MTTGPDQIKARIEALLAELPGEAELAELPATADIDELARRLEEAHDVLVHALESVEKG
jgi:surfactin synthase thioesterase subunit